MTNPTDIKQLPSDLQADAWVSAIKSGAGDEELLSAHIAWLRESDENIAAYAAAEATWELMNSLSSEPEFAHIPSNATKLDPQRAQVTPIRAVTLPHKRHDINQPAHPKRITRWSSAAAAVLIATLLSMLWSPESPQDQSTTFQTALGNIKTWQLDDGTAMTLNSNSRVIATYSENSRNVTVSRGEVLFKVAKDASRPFVVNANDGAIEVLGTLFNVRLMSEDDVKVSLVEGRVGVTAMPDQSNGGYRVLGAGQQITYSSRKGISDTQNFDSKAVLLWTEQLLDIDELSLTDAVAEINRYSPRPFVIEDDRIADQSISVFININNLSSLYTALETLYGLEAERRIDKIILRKKEHNDIKQK